jgi:broad specificity phosphatase PhoE
MSKLKILSFDFLRHGESCSNLYTGRYRDTSIKRPVGFGLINEDENKGELGELDDFIHKYRGSNFISNYFGKTFESLLYEPPLTYIGMQHAIKLGTDYIEKENKTYDLYITSAMTRTITTAFLSLRKRPNTIIYVMPYINEENKWFFTKLENTAKSSELLEKIVNFLRKWFAYNWIYYFDDIEVITDLLNIQKKLSKTDELYKDIEDYLTKRKMNKSYNNLIEDKLVRDNYNIQELLTKICNKFPEYSKYKDINNLLKGPQFDFTFLKLYEELYKNNKVPNPLRSNKDFFMKELLIKIIKTLNLNTKDKLDICVFSHGNFMRSFLKKYNKTFYKENEVLLKKELMNTSGINITMQYNNITSKIVYNPTKIRSKYNNFEKFNTDVCKLESIKGVTNLVLKNKRKIKHNNSFKDLEFMLNDKKINEIA